MYPSTDRFKAASQDSYVMSTLCEVRTQAGVLLTTLTLFDGDVIVDEQAQSPRRVADLNINVDNTADVVDSVTDLLAPDNNEIWLYRGIEYSDGATELMNLGVFTISDSVLDDSGGGYGMRLSCKDRVWRLARSPFSEDFVVVSGTQFIEAIRRIVTAVIPDVTIIADPDASTSALQVYKSGDDRWKACQELAASIGCEIYFNTTGQLTIKKIPNYALMPPVWEFNDNAATSVLLYINKRVTDDGFFNHIVVVGDAPENASPIRAEAADLNPASPTYIYGIGDFVRVVKDSAIKDLATASARATGELQKGLGLTELIYFSIIPFPVFELNEVFTLNRSHSLIRANYTIQKLAIPMTNDRPMYITCGKRVVV